MPKATKTETVQRIHEIQKLRLHGAEFADILQYASEKAWTVGPRQIRNYISAGGKLLAMDLEEDRGKLLARHVAQRRLLFARCMKINDYKTALAVVRDEAELQAVYAALALKVQQATEFEQRLAALENERNSGQSGKRPPRNAPAARSRRPSAKGMTRNEL